MKVFNDLKTRGVADILIAVADGLKGIGEALGAVFPATTLQTCIVHLIRNSLDYASWPSWRRLPADWPSPGPPAPARSRAARPPLRPPAFPGPDFLREATQSNVFPRHRPLLTLALHCNTQSAIPSNKELP
jgi:hypothetical protein